MSVEILLISLQYGVALLAFIGAINARGTARIALSWFLAFLCLSIAIFHTSQYNAGGPALASAKPKPSVGMVEEAAPAAPAPPPAAAASPVQAKDLSQSQADVAAGEARQKMNTIREAAVRLGRTLAAVDLENTEGLSDEEFQGLQAKAAAAAADAKRLRAQLDELGDGSEGLRPAREAVAKGLEELAAACAEYERFFHAEDQGEEAARRSAFKRHDQQAVAALAKAGNLLRGGSE